MVCWMYFHELGEHCAPAFVEAHGFVLLAAVFVAVDGERGVFCAAGFRRLKQERGGEERLCDGR